MEDDDRTPSEKAQDEALMVLRMAIRQIQSGQWDVSHQVYSTTPVPAGSNARGLTKYITGVSQLAITLTYDDGQRPEEADEAAGLPPIEQPVT